MTPSLSKSSLSLARRRLVELFRQVYFGKVEGLVVRDGDPVLSPLPRVIREIKLGGENGPRSEGNLGDFLLKSQIVELFALFDQFQDGVIEVLEIKHGLPFRVMVADTGS